MGRATQGVRLIKINEGDSIAAVAKVEVEAEVELDIDAETSGDENGTMTNIEETNLPSGDNTSPEN
jgi:DNA gyrase subunit A